jgi:hypothetical protein
VRETSFSNSPRQSQIDGSSQGEVGRVGDHVVLEGSQCTAELTGATFVQASSIAWKQGYTIAFVFSASEIAITCMQKLIMVIETTCAGCKRPSRRSSHVPLSQALQPLIRLGRRRISASLPMFQHSQQRFRYGSVSSPVGDFWGAFPVLSTEDRTQVAAVDRTNQPSC